MGRVSTIRLGVAMLLLCAGAARSSPAPEVDIRTVIGRTEAAWTRVEDYQTRVEVKSFGRDGSVKIERFLYSFKKPRWIRVDMETPHAGMTLIYPDENGKVIVRPGGRLPFPALHLAPDSRLLRVPSGQRLDQTDMGQLIAKISRSLTDQGRGPATLTGEGRYLLIRVLATNHFRPAVLTLYTFRIDEDSWLPVGVEEMTPGGKPERTVTFRELRINSGISPELFLPVDG